MKLVGKLLAFVILGLSLSGSSSLGKDLCSGFIPQNDMYIPVSANKRAATGISEETFNKVIDSVESFYKPIVTAKGATLKTNRLWTNGTVNASASQSGHVWTVNMYGGLARYSGMTQDGFALVMCHELGHHLGGFPKIQWAANEGQADYFSTMKCFRRVYEADALTPPTIPTVVKTACSKEHHSQQEIDLCSRESLAGLDLAKALNSMSGGTTVPAFTTPDQAQVSTTDDEHPEAQCRLDTYFAGSTCGISYSEDFSATSPAPGACAEEKGDTFGFRPHCWYKPQ